MVILLLYFTAVSFHRRWHNLPSNERYEIKDELAEAKVSKLSNIADRACAYGMPGEVVDGMEVLDVRAAVMAAVDRARRGEGPTLIEAKTYRWYGHAASDPRVYRTREEEREWRERDPIRLFKDKLEVAGYLREAEFEELQSLGAVGDIGLRFFNADGQFVEHEINQRIIGLDLGQIANIPRVIGVAGGTEKFDVIRAALRGKLINVLVTDEGNARRLLEAYD